MFATYRNAYFKNSMTSYERPLKLGNLTLSRNILYAPLAGCSDYSFRKVSSYYNPGITFCEMVKMDALIRHDPSTYHLLDYDHHMHPIGAQLCGSKPDLAGDCAKIIEDLGFDVVDLNCGCPVDKVTKDGSGSGLLKTPEKIGDILYQMGRHVSIPVTVKIRIGWDSQSINAKEITQIAEQAGAKAITIHGRTRAQGYKGPALWDPIKECVEAANKIKVIGNGDVVDGPSAKALFEQTGCDGILIGRATMGKPWIAEEISHFLKTGNIYLPCQDLVKQAFLEHMRVTLSYENDRYALLAMRRIACWYLKERKGARELREGINKSKTLKELLALINSFDWDEEPSLLTV